MIFQAKTQAKIFLLNWAPEPLSAELSEWADGADEGLVIFCLGHTLHLRLDRRALSSLAAAFSR